MKNENFKNVLEDILKLEVYPDSETSVLEVICLKLIEKAYSGDLKAITFIRDTIGQQPFKEMFLSQTETNNIVILDDLVNGLKQSSFEEENEEYIIKEALYRRFISLYGYERTKELATGEMSHIEALADSIFNG